MAKRKDIQPRKVLIEKAPKPIVVNFDPWENEEMRSMYFEAALLNDLELMRELDELMKPITFTLRPV